MKWQVCDCPGCTNVPMYWHERYGQLCEVCYDNPKVDLAKCDNYCMCPGCKALRRLRDEEARLHG